MSNVWNVYDASESKKIDEIHYARDLYKEQVSKVEKEEYLKNLMLRDYIAKVRSNISRYDVIVEIFRKASCEVNNKKKADRQHLETIEDFIKDDFLSSNHNFKLISIEQCGYEGYAWRVNFEGFNKKIYISVPIMNEISTKNFEYANCGMFAFHVEISNNYWELIKMSYDIKEVSDAVSEYFKLNEHSDSE